MCCIRLTTVYTKMVIMVCNDPSLWSWNRWSLNSFYINYSKWWVNKLHPSATHFGEILEKTLWKYLPSEHGSCREVEENISRRQAKTQAVDGQGGGVRGRKDRGVGRNFEWRLGVDGPRMVDITLGWNQDKFCPLAVEWNFRKFSIQLHHLHAKNYDCRHLLTVWCSIERIRFSKNSSNVKSPGILHSCMFTWGDSHAIMIISHDLPWFGGALNQQMARAEED